MNENYMNDIYEVLNSQEEEFNEDGIEYLDEPCDELFYEDEALAWGDDIIYLDEPEEEFFDLDLGEGYIPLPQIDVQEEELVVIDENYILDEFEEDLVENYVRPVVKEQKEVQDFPREERTMDYSLEEIFNIIHNGYDEIDLSDYDPEPMDVVIDLDEAESIIKLPVQEDLAEELNVTDMTEEDSKLAADIAKEHINNMKACEGAGLLYGDNENPEDDTSWVDGEDLFGNDINVIIADDPNKEIEEDDFEEGSFSQWLLDQNSK